MKKSYGIDPEATLKSYYPVILYRIKRSIIFTFLILAIFNTQSYSQLEDKTVRQPEKEFFFIDPLVFYSKDEMKARLDIYIEVPLDNLQFKKNYSTKDYDASIKYTIKVTNIANEIVVNESIKDYVSTSKDGQKSLEGSAKFIVKEFYLNPGAYSLEVSLQDINTSKEETLKDKIKIVDFTLENVSFSDIMLVSNLKIENGKKVITPLIDKNIDNLQEIYLFFEVYNSKNQNVLTNYQYIITGAKDKVYEKGNYQYNLNPGINKFFEKIPTDNLVFGDYKLEIKDTSTDELIAVKDFSNKLNGMPVNAKDMNLMIGQLLYIASGEELSKIKNAPTEDLKEKYFIEYWRSKDPSPNTTKNELMIEYYRRIETANERYSHYIDGWKTDMGMIYIIYGEPNSIDRVPFPENSKPYQIWQYYTDNKEFIFFDETGFGDYQLAIPIWDDRGTKIRN